MITNNLKCHPEIKLRIDAMNKQLELIRRNPNVNLRN